MQWPHLSIEVLPLLAVVSPLIGLITTVVTARWNRPLVRPMAIANALMTILLVAGMIAIYRPDQVDGRSGSVRQMQSAVVWLQDRPAADHTTEERVPQGFNVRLSFGIDGLCAWPALLLAITVWAALYFPGRLREDSFCAYCTWMMLSESLLLASLTTSDAITGLVFIEAALLPMYLLVGVCGEANRRNAAGALWIWQFAGCTCSLFGVTLLAVSRPWMQSDLVSRRGPLLFDTSLLMDNVQQLLGRSEIALHVWSHLAPWAGLLLILGFAIRLPAFPFHGWYESTLNAAPAGAAALIAAVFPLVALNGWLRFGSPLFSEDGTIFTGILGTFSILGLWRAGLMAHTKTDLRQLMATISSGLLCLSCTSLNTRHLDGVRGAWLLALSQGLAVAVGILATEMLQQRCNTREITHLGPLVRDRPRLAAVLIIALLGWVGMPFLTGFAALSLVFFTAGTSMLLVLGETVAVALLASSVLRAIGYCMFDRRGSTTTNAREDAATWQSREFTDDRDQTRGRSDPEPAVPPDLTLQELITFAPLLCLLLILNLAPSVVLDSCEPSMRHMFRHVGQASIPF